MEDITMGLLDNAHEHADKAAKELMEIAFDSFKKEFDLDGMRDRIAQVVHEIHLIDVNLQFIEMQR